MIGTDMKPEELVKIAKERLLTAARGYAHAVCTKIIKEKKNEPQKLEDLLAGAYIAGVQDCLRAQEVKNELHGKVQPGQNPVIQ